jgi:hypothetical protein
MIDKILFGVLMISTIHCYAGDRSFFDDDSSDAGSSPVRGMIHTNSFEVNKNRIVDLIKQTKRVTLSSDIFPAGEIDTFTQEEVILFLDCYDEAFVSVGAPRDHDKNILDALEAASLCVREYRKNNK